MFSKQLIQATSTSSFEGIGVSLAIIIVLIVIWSVFWKALALWKAARKGEKIWFIILLIVNTCGILQIIYLLINREPKKITTNNIPQNETNSNNQI